MPTYSRPNDTKIKVIIEGGPQLAAALDELDAKIKRQHAVAALTAAGRVIADQWASMAPVGMPPEDDYPGAYQQSLQDAGAVTARGSKTGATATVKPAVIGIPEDRQPRLYAARLEFGDADRDAFPSARPAFDSALDRAVAAISDSLADAI